MSVSWDLVLEKENTRITINSSEKHRKWGLPWENSPTVYTLCWGQLCHWEPSLEQNRNWVANHFHWRGRKSNLLFSVTHWRAFSELGSECSCEQLVTCSRPPCRKEAWGSPFLLALTQSLRHPTGSAVEKKGEELALGLWDLLWWWKEKSQVIREQRDWFQIGWAG